MVSIDFEELSLEELLEMQDELYSDLKAQKNETRPMIEYFNAKMGQHNWFVNSKGETNLYQTKKQWLDYVESKKKQSSEIQ